MIAGWIKWREDVEQLARDIGAALQEVVLATEWASLDREARRVALERARRLIHDHHGLVRDTWLEWDEDYDPGLWYDEKTGAIHFPDHHLDTATAEQCVGGLAEEMRHAWQFDVVDRRLDHPLGAIGRERLGDAYAIYDPTNAVSYSGSELEMDAQDFAADVVSGYRGD
jgi:hypothetical protein